MNHETLVGKESQTSWEGEYYKRLAEVGWKFYVDPNPKGKLVSARDEKTDELLEGWKKSEQPVEISIVIVVPNDDFEDLPLKSLGYVSTALNYASYVRKTGVNVNSLRLMSPCHANIYANGGNLERQLGNAEIMKKLAEAYKNAFFPDLEEVSVFLDTGKPITIETEKLLKRKVDQIKEGHEEIASGLEAVSQKYFLEGQVTEIHLLEPEEKPIAYLLAHPEAWSYSRGQLLFGKNGSRVINFMPCSELRYLAYMKDLEGEVWEEDPEKQIATVISGKQTRAPYYPFTAPGPWAEEPRMRELLNPGGIQIALSKLKQFSGRPEIAEIITNLNQIKTDQEQANKRSKNGNRPIDLSTIYKEALEV